MNSSTAILLFSRSIAAEARQKQLLTGQRANASLIRGMIASTESLLQRSGLPYHIITEAEQRGNNFGEKIANAVERVFAQGYENLIILGNDCPQLKVADLHAAAAALETGCPVLGRDHHDGAYLIGLQRAQFSADRFTDLAWQKEGIYEELSALLRLENRLLELRTLVDLNESVDLRSQWQYLLGNAHLATLLKAVFCQLGVLRAACFFREKTVYFLNFPQRGPPLWA